MKRTLSLALALVMALGLAVVPAAAEEEAHIFRPQVSPGVTKTETAIDTGVPGLTLTLGADEWSVTALDEPMESAGGVSYTSFLTGKANPKAAEGTGTYYSFTLDESVKTGALELMYRLNSGKAFYIMDNGEAMDGFDGSKLDVSADASTTLIVQGGHTYTVYASGSKLRLYGCSFQNVEPQEVFAGEIARFPFERIRGANADAAHVDEDLALMDSYESQFGSCDVSWTTSDASVVDLNGAVSCQKTETQVKLTGHFSVQENRALAADVTFDLTVLADPDDVSAVAVAKEALTLGDTSSVKRDLELPTVGKRGCAIAWQSSDEAVVGADGKVYPAADVDQKATLTATITRGDAVETKTFDVTVAGIVPVTLDSWSYQDANGVTRFSYAPGARLHSVNVTCNNPNPGPDDTIFVQVCAADGTVKASHDFSMRETFANIPVGKSTTLYMDLPMDSGDHVEVMARNVKTGATLVEPVKADDTVSDGAVIYVVGDSTASVYGDDRYPRKGWAQMLEGYFDGVEVVDLALSGRSSGSFKSEANYATLKNSLKKGDYLLIQFGHNDNKADCYADPAGDRFTEGSFQASMLEYVELAWEKGAKPIIATSISRRKLSDEGLEAYAKAAAALAYQLSIPCIDLYAATNGYVNDVGVDAAMDMYNCVKPYDSRFMGYAPFAGSEFYEKGSSDDTHLNIYGADLIAQWFVEGAAQQGLPLAAKVNDYSALWPLPSYAQATETPPKTFSDLPAGHWAKAAVDYLTAQDVLQGTDETHFSPDMSVSRAMVATVLNRLAGRLAGLPSGFLPGGHLPASNMFSDVADDQWYSGAVSWCAECGIVRGYDDGAFGPDDPITREQLCVMLRSWAGTMGLQNDAQRQHSDEGTAILAFPDTGDVSDWAKTGMTWAVETGVIAGKGDGALAPQDVLTRSELAAVLQRLAAFHG